MTAALEARILGTAVTLAGCTLPEGVDGQAAVRLHAARCLAKLSAGLMLMNAACGGAAARLGRRRAHRLPCPGRAGGRGYAALSRGGRG